MAGQVDFYSMLSGLGDTIQANQLLRQKQQVNAARQQAFSSFTALDPNSPDYGRQALTVAQRLGSVGDQEGALKFLSLAQTAADKAQAVARDNRDFNFRVEESRRTQANADRAFDKDKYIVKEIEDANGNKTLVRVKTDGPEGAINPGVAAAAEGNPFGGVNFKNNEQAKSAGFANRMLQSEAILSGAPAPAGQEGPPVPGIQDVGASSAQTGLSKIPGVGNFLISNDRQKYEQARRDFSNAKLRQESGATIQQSEIDNADKQYFPVPGDSPEVIKQKAANRRVAIESMGQEAGRGYRPKFVFGSDGTLVPYQPKTAEPERSSMSAKTITTQEEYAALPRGALYIAPDGSQRVKR